MQYWSYIITVSHEILVNAYFQYFRALQSCIYVIETILFNINHIQGKLFAFLITFILFDFKTEVMHTMFYQQTLAQTKYKQFLNWSKSFGLFHT